MSKVDLSIVIVTYNVKDFLFNCIESIYSSKCDLNYEIIVVDNNSLDNSKEYIKSKFREVNYLYNDENLGFSKANNQGFEEANGDYVLILNPDTLLEENTLQKMFDFLEGNSEIGAAGCKVLNEDRSFQLACRRSFPNPWNSFCKLFGLQTLFPKLKLFSGYNLTYKSIDETYKVDALIGAFIFTRKSVIDKIGGFSEEYFMYGEDLDFCHKISDYGYDIYYYHKTSIIHYKGESTKRSSINEVKHFYEAMEIFAKKYYGKSLLFLLFLKIGIFLREMITYVEKYKSDIIFILSDMIVMMLAYLTSMYIRFDIFSGNQPDTYEMFPGFLLIIYFISNFFSGLYFESNFSLKKMLRSHIFFFVTTAVITYSFKEYDFSRIVLILLTSFSFIINYCLRLIFKHRSQKEIKNIIYIGEDDNIIKYFKDLNTKLINFKGNFSINDDINPIIELEYIDKFIKNNDINEIFISKNTNKIELLDSKLKKINSSLVLNKVNDLSDVIVSRNLNTAIGYDLANDKSKLTMPRFIIIKRTIDIIISLSLLIVGLPFIVLFVRNKAKKMKELLNVLLGKKSIVGYYNYGNLKYELGKEGLISLAEISLNNFEDKKSILKLNESYLKNYTPSLDFEIILKNIFK